jgi:hypothetical protein
MSRLFVWHGHHDTLCEFLDPQERIAVIRREKSDEEIPLWLRLMQPVKHPERLPSKWREADQKLGEADQKWREADQKWREADQKWRKAYQKWRESDQKWREAYQKHLPEIEALHKVDCQAAREGTCPWNGKTIFPAEARE